ncbi:uncharacterized protein LOC132637170 [Lycium barbarum]|uniref:uncharacterized protein LOC132637170 n=1 Tax=Lycium barbarum TaxID=112863 RepID=UPI00293ED143|nr:uncharacterized protein LOC132637170 [Lycium barbarum]
MEKILRPQMNLLNEFSKTQNFGTKGKNRTRKSEMIKNWRVKNESRSERTGGGNKVMVKHFLINHRWNMTKLYNMLPGDIALHISTIDTGQEDSDDYAIWDKTENVAKFGKQGFPNCICCTIPENDSIQHVFVEGQVADHIWQFIGAPLGINHQHIPINGLLHQWWNQTANNKTVWNIKTALNVAVPNIDFGGNWISTCATAERIKPVQKCTPICWKKPQPGKFKANTDGSFCSTSKRAGIGGILRDEHGKMVMAFSIPVECESSNHAEALAVEFGSSWCKINGINDIQMELDSLIIANMLTKQNLGNLKLKHIINKILKNVEGTNIEFLHCFREANSVADYLAKLALSSRTRSVYYSHDSLPGEAKGLTQLDQWQLPTFRRRFEKSNFFVS